MKQIIATEPDHARLPFEPQYDHGSAFVIDSYCGLDDAAVPIVDTGFMHADAAYDVVSTSKGVFFRLDDHLERFENSCKKFRLKNPYSREQTTEILTNLVKLAGTKDSYVWFAVTRGIMPDERSDIDAYQNLFYAFVFPYIALWNDAQRTNGLDLMVSEKYIRIHPDAVDPTAKNFHLLDKLEQTGQADDTIFIFTSDNGPEYTAGYQGYQGWSGPWRGSYFTALEGSLRVPMSEHLKAHTQSLLKEPPIKAGTPDPWQPK